MASGSSGEPSLKATRDPGCVWVGGGGCCGWGGDHNPALRP